MMRALLCAVAMVMGAAVAVDSAIGQVNFGPGASAGSDALPKDAAAQKRHNDASVRASKAYFVAMIAADRQLVSDLESAMKVANTGDVDQVRADLAAATADLTRHLASLKDGELVEAMHRTANDQKAALASDLKIGMTEDDCDAIEKARGWEKVVINTAAKSEEVDYRSAILGSTGFREKDVCLFVDGKLVSLSPIRVSK